MPVVGKLKDKNFLIAGELNERLPLVVDGLVAHFPFDGKNGCMDVMNKHLNPTTPILSNTNLIEIAVDWTDPTKWFTTNWKHASATCAWDYAEGALKFTAGSGWALDELIQIDPTKNWYIYAEVKTNNTANSFYLGDISYDINGNTTPQHPGTYEYFGALGGTPSTTSYSVFTNGSPRTGTSSSIGNTLNWNTDMYAIKPHIIVNYDARDTTNITWVKNLKLYYTNSDNSNVTMHYDSIGIEEATTNVVPTPDIFSSGWSPYTNGHDGAFMTEFGVEGLNLVNRQSWCGAYKGVTLPATGTYTLSVWVKPISRTNSAINITLYTSGGGIGDTNVSASWSEDKIGQWQKLTMTRTYTTTSITLYLICFGGADAAGYNITCQYTKPQIEQKKFATSFVVGSRSAGQLFIDKIGGYTDYTVFGKFTPDSAFVNATGFTSTPDQASLICLSDTVNNGNVYFRYWENGASSLPFLDPDGHFGTGHIHVGYTINENQPLYYAIRKENSSLKMKLYQNNTWKGEHELILPNTSRLDKISFGNTTIWSGLHEGLSIYNRPLTDKELDILVSTPYKLLFDGTLITERLSEVTSLGNGKDGALTVTNVNTVVNKYAYITDYAYEGFTEINVDSTTGFSVGDEIMIYQTQQWEHSVGRYEFNTIKSIISSTIIGLNSPIKGPDYESGSFDVVNSSYVTQVVKIPNYSSVTINVGASLTCDTWNGKKGGILIFRCQGNLVNNGSINVDSKGFRGGRASGIGGFADPSGDGECGEGFRGRGAQGFYSGSTPVVVDSGGLTYVNGSGGSNGTQGVVGTTYDSYYPVPPSIAFNDKALTRILLGGGGGGGHNNAGQPCGGNGGGAIMIYTKSVGGTISANGQAAYFNPSRGFWGAGGGAGGTVYIETSSGVPNITISGGASADGTSQNGGNGGAGISNIVYRKSIDSDMNLKNGINLAGNIDDCYSL